MDTGLYSLDCGVSCKGVSVPRLALDVGEIACCFGVLKSNFLDELPSLDTLAPVGV